MSRWFRMYDEVLDDPKVQRLNGDDFKAWVNMLCLASRKDGALPAIEDIGFALRLDAKKAQATVARMVAAELLDNVDGRFVPHGWNARQYKSDVSTGRVKQFRERKKAVAGNGDGTFHETAPDTETDTEKSSVTNVTGEKSPSADPGKVFWDNAKTYLGKSKAPMIGRWVGEYGRDRTAAALAQAQVERAVDPVPYVEAILRKPALKVVGGAGHSGVPL